MKKTITFLLLLALISILLPISYAEEVSTYQLEKALMKYILSYEALKKAKQNPNQQSSLPKYIKNYNEAYSQYLSLLKAADLYDPTNPKKENDPAGNYNKKMVEKGGRKQIWETVDTSSQREMVREAVKSGKEPDQVAKVVNNNLPKTPISKPEQPPNPPVTTDQTIFNTPSTDTSTDTNGSDDQSTNESSSSIDSVNQSLENIQKTYDSNQSATSDSNNEIID